ncbi:hypothetical protein QQ25_16810 [Mycolicibacterium setense]|nr:hypothetical protein QQ25_16810 [Mycolicibacterium setense]
MAKVCERAEIGEVTVECQQRLVHGRDAFGEFSGVWLDVDEMVVLPERAVPVGDSVWSVGNFGAGLHDRESMTAEMQRYL